MPRWRRRRFAKKRRRERNNSSNEIVIRHADGTVMRFKWNLGVHQPGAQPRPLTKKTKLEGDGPFLLNVAISGINKCTECGTVWLSGQQHTRRECRTKITQQVLED